jgi:hypothetical protein
VGEDTGSPHALHHELIGVGQSVLADTSATEAKKLKEVTIQVKYDQLRLDLGQLITSVMAHKWTHSEEYIVTLGMKTRSAWIDQHAAISKKLIEVEGFTKLHDLRTSRIASWTPGPRSWPCLPV